MSSPPLFTVIINCFNGEKYLSDSINSVLCQTLSDFELIIWDNCSTDASLDIAHSFRDPRIRVYQSSSHMLLYPSRNLALQKACGVYISFLDVDDVWFPTKLAKQAEAFKDSSIGFVCTAFYSVNPILRKQNLFIPSLSCASQILPQLLRKYPVCMSSLAVRSSTLSQLTHCFDENYQLIGDFDLSIRLALVSRLAVIETPQLNYLMHGSNLSVKERYRYCLELEHWVLKSESNPLLRLSVQRSLIPAKALYLRLQRQISLKCFSPLPRICIALSFALVRAIPAFLTVPAPLQIKKVPYRDP